MTHTYVVRTQKIQKMNEIVLCALVLLCRIVVGLWGYSGFNIPPMFGDFEAQRHWLEVTTSLPIGEWYKHTDRNDLLYWGLDYPPLTAYVSFMFGKVAAVITPGLVELTSSRGYEGIDGKVFMRVSVVLCDVVLLIPITKIICDEVITWVTKSGFKPFSNRSLYRLVCLLTPGLLLIDHGHFQYNGVCLALALYGTLLICRDQDILGSIFFCLSLNFKQMSLYYAPVFFCCLLRKCLEQPSIAGKIAKLASLGITVVSVFGLLWVPFCLFHHPEDTCAGALLQVLQRQFPFSRGIFEDKVANIWYSLSVVVDFRAFLSPTQLLAASLSLTLLLLAPTCYFLLTTPASIATLLLAMSNSALAFFLASFQVHEKSVLLVLAPAAFLLLTDAPFFSWAQVLGCFTMFPLLVKDKLRIPYVTCVVGFLALAALSGGAVVASKVKGKHTLWKLLGLVWRYENKRSWSAFLSQCVELLTHDTTKTVLVVVSFLGMLILHALELWMPPPARLPDLYAALFSIFGAANLCYLYCVCVMKMFTTGELDGSSKMECCESSNDTTAALNKSKCD